VTLPKPMTSGAKADGRFGKQDFRSVVAEDVYVCPAGERLAYHYTNEENGLVLRRYCTNACQSCAIKRNCTTGKERRITRWEHEHVLERAHPKPDLPKSRINGALVPARFHTTKTQTGRRPDRNPALRQALT
jgi:hypothetical protein